MMRRLSSAVLAIAAVLFLVDGFAAIRSASAASCPLLRAGQQADATRGAALFNGTNCSSCTLKCVNCHGDPGLPCNGKNSPLKTCYPCPYPQVDPTIGTTNIALYGARPATLRGFMLGNEGMGNALTAAQVKQMFADLGITTEADLKDLATFLASKDPRRYTISGTIDRSQGDPSDVTGVLVCSDYNPPAAGAVLASNPALSYLTYSVENLPPGDYTVVPTAPQFFDFKPSSRGLSITFLATSIEGCIPPDCTLPPVCSTGVTPVDFMLLGQPVCDFQLNKASYVDGDKAIAQVVRLANPREDPLPIELKVWFEAPGFEPIPFINLGADGAVKIPAKFDKDLGPLPLFTVTKDFPRGSYALDCRFLHPVTGAPLAAEDLNPFAIK